MFGRETRGERERERAFLTSEPVGSVFHDDRRYEVNRLAEPVATQRHTQFSRESRCQVIDHRLSVSAAVGGTDHVTTW